MKPAEIKLTRLLRSRLCAVLLTALALAGAAIPIYEPALPEQLGLTSRGLLYPSPWEWTSTPAQSMGWALALNLLVVALMLLINRRFNLLRTYSWLFMGLFAVMQGASPLTLRTFSGGIVAAAVMLWSLWLMYTAYHRRRRVRRVFLAFCIVSAASMVQYGFVVYLAVLLCGCIQMRVFSLRTLVAVLLGIVTPWWIAFGMWWAVPGMVQWPHLSFSLSGATPAALTTHFGPVLFTLLAGMVAGGANLFKILTYNARMRALHGLLAVLSITTGVMCVVDFANYLFYLPLLNVTVAFQTGHFFRINLQRRGYLWVLFLLLAYIAIFICKAILFHAG